MRKPTEERESVRDRKRSKMAREATLTRRAERNRKSATGRGVKR